MGGVLWLRPHVGSGGWRARTARPRDSSAPCSSLSSTPASSRRSISSSAGVSARARWRGGRFGRGKRAVDQLQPGHGLVAEVPVDALHDERLQVLQFDRQAAAGDTEVQRSLAALSPRVDDPLGGRELGEARADDGGPVADDGAVGEAATAEQGPGDGGNDGREARGPPPRRRLMALLMAIVLFRVDGRIGAPAGQARASIEGPRR